MQAHSNVDMCHSNHWTSSAQGSITMPLALFGHTHRRPRHWHDFSRPVQGRLFGTAEAYYPLKPWACQCETYTCPL